MLSLALTFQNSCIQYVQQVGHQEAPLVVTKIPEEDRLNIQFQVIPCHFISRLTTAVTVSPIAGRSVPRARTRGPGLVSDTN